MRPNRKYKKRINKAIDGFQTLNLKPDDILVVKVDELIGCKMRKDIITYLNMHFENDIIVLDNDIKLEKISKEEQNKM